MTTLIEAITSIAKGFLDEEPKPPLHVGEVMALWTALALHQEGYSMYELAMNTTTDPDLLHALRKARESSAEDIHSIKEFLVKEGVPLPTTSEPKPHANPNAIPYGVKLTDDEICNLISAKVASSIALCGSGIAESVRADVGYLFLQSMVRLMKFGAPLRVLMRERGWIKIPPYYYPPGGIPNQ
ncbi:DUF3231 family protein [Tumebacillus sp. ITR2]|uniref:DUF3231 family protein n=1 Tax=Tumebacillus amylolyticus TaxID=2801339 RepID=A0ABS1JC74_9BACL|nr:DUF3231 family protein [Tumebacillus amylolyticus]MBL0387839.1 DUF3231 family protein [Tumebacillus amylolyticus]